MKKVTKLILPIMLIISLLLTSCGNSESTEVLTNPHETDSKFRVAIVQYNDNTSFNEMRKAFIARMRTLGYDEAKMTFDIKNAQGDDAKLNEIASSLVNSDYNLIVPIATKAAIAIKDSGNTIPSVFIGVTDPVGSSLAEALASPDKNMTGTTYSVDTDSLFVLAKILIPSMAHIGIVYTSGDSTTSSTIEASKAYLTDGGYTYEELVLDSIDGIDVKIADLMTRTDVLFIPQDAQLESCLDTIISAVTSAGKFVFASSEGAVDEGVLASSGISYTELGRSSALLADKILQGNKVSSVPISEMSEPTQFISSATAKARGVDLPKSLENTITK